jgi:hypothetical protein
MTAYRFPTLTCDGCFEVFDGGVQTMSIRVLRQLAKGEGWATGWLPNRALADFCPKCHAKGKGHRS